MEYFGIIGSRLIAECFAFIFHCNLTAADMKKFRVSACRRINTVCLCRQLFLRMLGIFQILSGAFISFFLEFERPGDEKLKLNSSRGINHNKIKKFFLHFNRHIESICASCLYASLLHKEVMLLPHRSRTFSNQK